MSLKEIKFGSTHFILDEASGFWLNPKATDPMSATLSPGEVEYILEEAVASGRKYLVTFEQRVRDLEKTLELLKETRKGE